MSEYEIRPFAPGDRDGFLSLYDTVFGTHKSDDWFTWKYENNPYVDHVPIFLGVDEDRIVGARSFFALRVAWDDTQRTVLQPCDTMVHPDHRRQGLFTRMTEEAIDRYQREYPFFFNFPNQQSLPGNLKLGWQTVSKRDSFLRIEHPGQLLTTRTDSTPIRVASGLSTALAQGYHTLKELFLSPPETPTIARAEDVPAATLAGLYRQQIPDQIHAVRDEQFHTWRWQNPEWAYTTYVAVGAGEPIAAIVAGQPQHSAVDTVKCIDFAPLDSDAERGLSALVAQILDDYAGADLFIAPTEFPQSVLRDFGFWAGTSFPLSFFVDQQIHVVRPLSGEAEQTALDLTKPDSWLLTFAEMDVN